MQHWPFKEVQQFRQWWMWLVLFISLFPLPFIFTVRTITGNTITNNHSAHLLFVSIVFAVALLALLIFLFLKFSLRADETGIWYGFNIPDTSLNLLKWEDIRTYQIIRYPFVGYGYRLHPVYGTVYNVRGNTGLFITTNTGQHLLLGTQYPRELAFTLDIYLKTPQGSA